VRAGDATFNVAHILKGGTEDFFLVGAMGTPEQSIHPGLLRSKTLGKNIESIGSFRPTGKRAGDENHQRQNGGNAKSLTHTDPMVSIKTQE
jgi:hypothetical protein